jgi:hypothetical protein
MLANMIACAAFATLTLFAVLMIAASRDEDD